MPSLFSFSRKMMTVILLLVMGPAFGATDKPNILVIFGDDIGMWNISAYHRGMMGGSTPNIDRIANEGALY
jgi:arylsulfatase